jgi:hypothetical protein
MTDGRRVVLVILGKKIGEGRKKFFREDWKERRKK